MIYKTKQNFRDTKKFKFTWCFFATLLLPIILVINSLVWLGDLAVECAGYVRQFLSILTYNTLYFFKVEGLERFDNNDK